MFWNVLTLLKYLHLYLYIAGNGSQLWLVCAIPNIRHVSLIFKREIITMYQQEISPLSYRFSTVEQKRHVICLSWREIQSLNLVGFFNEWSHRLLQSIPEKRRAEYLKAGEFTAFKALGAGKWRAEFQNIIPWISCKPSHVASSLVANL